jgi:hypothetical protein
MWFDQTGAVRKTVVTTTEAPTTTTRPSTTRRAATKRATTKRVRKNLGSGLHGSRSERRKTKIGRIGRIKRTGGDMFKPDMFKTETEDCKNGTCKSGKYVMQNFKYCKK